MKRKASAALIAATSAAVAKRRARWQRKFLDALAKVPSVKAACEVAGVNRTLVYKVRKCDLEFAEQWREAIDASVDDVEAKAFRFALEDTDPATANARVRLWEFILRSHRPSTYRERQEVGIVGGIVLLPAKAKGDE